MSWIEKLLPPRINRNGAEARQSIPAGLWIKCPACEAVLYRADLEANLHVCPKCSHHLRIRARVRLDALLDMGGRHEIGQEVLPVDTLKFTGSKSYPARLRAAMEATGETDALVVMAGAILSGGARMQEGLMSLMQMAKTTAMLARLAEKKLPFVSVLTDPTSGGISASFCFLGDIVIAEPKALIAFTGARVIKSTLGVTLPEGYQRPEFLLERGAIDMIVDRRDMRAELAALLALLLKLPTDAIAKNATESRGVA